MEDENGKKTIRRNTEIDLIELIRLLWSRRKLVIIITGAFFLLGLITAITTPNQYKAVSRMLPEVKNSDVGGAAALLKQFGGIGGFSIPADGADAIGPLLYPDVLNSTPFFMQLLDTVIQIEIKGEVRNMDVYTYMDEYADTFWGSIAKYTIKLPYTILAWLRDSNNESEILPISTIFPKVTKAQFDIIENLKERINSSIDHKTGVITISAEFADPFLAAQITDFAVNYLSNYITQYRIEKASNDFDFILARYLEKEKEYEKAQLDLAKHKDSNKNIILASTQVEEQRLSNQYTLAFNVYSGLAQQLEQARIKVQEETPVIKVLEPVQIPAERSKPSRTLMLLVFTILGAILGAGTVIARLIWLNIKHIFKNN